MNWKSFIAGAVIGIIGSYAAKEIISQRAKISPEKVLENVKKQFNQNGQITGSWIHMAAEPYEKQQIHYQVYKGGISKNVDGKSEQYEFAADATTGTLIDVLQVSGTM